MGRYSSGSPMRGRASPPRRRSPSRREQSPARQRSSNPEKVSSRNRSPRRSRSRSPVDRSTGRVKPSNRARSPIHRRSPSPASHSPAKQRTTGRNKSPKRVKPRSPSPISPVREKPRLRDRSPERVNPRHSISKSRSPDSRSPSPRSKRLKRVKAEYDVEKRSRKEHERKGDRVVGEVRNSDEGLPGETEKKERRQGRDVNNSSRSRRERSASPGERHQRGRHRSRSPYDDDNRGRDERTNRRNSEDRNEDDDSLAKMKAAEEKLESKEKEKQKPSFELSGKLAEETNRFRGITLLFSEPPDARKPDVRWRLYVFKGGEVLSEPLYIHRQSCYLFGRERRVADIPTDHPSCSKQHAVLQYRQVEVENPDGTLSKKVRPYLMDLGSTNKTFINDTPMEPQRYYELFEKDTIKFGNSSREYVLLHENSAT